MAQAAVPGATTGRGMLRTRPAHEKEPATWALKDKEENGGSPGLAPVTMVRLRSTASVIEAIVDFQNMSDSEVQAIWLDFNGNEIAYTVIGPKARRRYRTYVSHPWIIREVGTGARFMLNERMVVVANSPEQTVHITAPPQLKYSLATHKYYPTDFKQAAQALLLSHHHVRHTQSKGFLYIEDDTPTSVNMCSAPAGPPSSPFAAAAKLAPAWAETGMDLDTQDTTPCGQLLGRSLFPAFTASSILGSELSSCLDDDTGGSTRQPSRAVSSCMSTSTSYSTLPVTSEQPLGPVLRGRTETRAAKLLGWVIQKVARVTRSPSSEPPTYRGLLRGSASTGSLLQPPETYQQALLHHMSELPTHLVVFIIQLMAPDNVTQCITRGPADAYPDIAPALLITDPATWASHDQPEEVVAAAAAQGAGGAQ